MTIQNSTCSFDDKLESFLDKEEMGDKISQNYELGIKGFLDRNGEESRESSSSSDFLASELTINDKHSSSEDPFSPPSKICPIQEVGDVKTPKLDKNKFEKKEIEMMKKKFAKLLLGEDMSGCGNGVSTALATSNAITNLCATLFGQIWRLEPLPLSKKLRWRREIEWFLCVSNHIVELTPCLQTFPDGSEQEVMTSRARSDLYVNLPALRKLDTMLLEILDSFENTEFWYVDKGSLAPEEDGSSSFRKPLPHEEEKWWLPVPRVSASGLSKDARKQLQHRRDCTKQILKAAMAINSITLADMEVPESYLEALPKNVKASLGDLIYGYINADQFSPECLLDCLHLTSEKQALKVANRVEASIHIWRQRASKTLNIENQSNSKSSWEMVKDLVVDADKSEILADRAEGLLLCLKQKFPCLSQTTLDMSKIKFNTDIGKSILESYSRVLKSLAFNIICRIDDLLYVDDLTRHSDQSASISKVVTRAENNVKVMPISGTPNNTAFNTPSISPIRNTSPTKVESSSSILEQNKPCHEDDTRAENSIKIEPISGTPNNTAFTTPSISPIINTSPTKVQRSSSILEKHKPHLRGLGVKKSLTDYLSIDISNTKLKDSSSPARKSESDSSSSRTNQESFTPQSVDDSCELLKDSASPSCTIHLGKNELENLVPLTITKAFTFVSDCF